jgi:hypothetical protein
VDVKQELAQVGYGSVVRISLISGETIAPRTGFNKCITHMRIYKGSNALYLFYTYIRAVCQEIARPFTMKSI